MLAPDTVLDVMVRSPWALMSNPIGTNTTGRRGVHVLSQDGFCVATAVNGLGPKDVGRREVIRVKGQHEVGSVERGVELNEFLSRCTDGLVAEDDVEPEPALMAWSNLS